MNYPLTAAAAGQVAPVTRPIPSAMDEMDNGLAQLHDVITALQDRLGSILGPSKPQSVENNAKGPQAAPTLANRIYSHASTVRAARERMGELLDRLEI